MKQTIAVLLLSLSLAPVLSAGYGEHSGREPHTWDSGHLSVVVGTLKNVKRIENTSDDFLYSATLLPKAMLAGSVDPSANPALSVRFHASPVASSVPELPAGEPTVIAVIYPGDVDEVADGGRIYHIASSLGWTFMPSSQALVVIKGLGDPRVEETLSKIQEARAHPDPDPNAARPSSSAKSESTSGGSKK